MGNQGSALNGLRRAVELIHGGLLGVVREAHVWTNRPAHYWKHLYIVSRPKEVPLVPAHVHWQEWLGPRLPVLTTVPTTHTIGVATGTLARAHLETWRAIPRTWRFGP